MAEFQLIELAHAAFPHILKDLDHPVALEAMSLRDARKLWAHIVSDRARSDRREIWRGVESLSDAKTYLATCDIDDSKTREFSYFIHDTSSGGTVGTLHLYSISWWHRKIEVGYGVHHLHEGRGWVSAALRLVEKYLREKGFRRIEIRCDTTNLRSCAVAERNGFQLEGVLRKDRRIGDSYQDTAIYGKLLDRRE